MPKNETDFSLTFLQNADPLDVAWAAGLFEGEGSVSVVPNTARSRRIYMRLDMHSTDDDVLKRFGAVVGVGRVRGPYLTNGKNHKPHHKPYWTWSITGRRALLLATHAPFADQLGSRRRSRIAEVIAILGKQPPHSGNGNKTHCPQGHPYDEENTYRAPTGGRMCRKCRNAQKRAYLRRKAAV